MESRLYVEYAYDLNGNTTSRAIYKSNDEIEVIEFDYDGMNRLVKTTKSVYPGDIEVEPTTTESTVYFYDNAGNRFIKQDGEGTTIYLRHGQIAVAMDIELPIDSSEEKAVTNRYILSGDLLAGRVTSTLKADDSIESETFYYHLDHLNSTKAVTDENGEIVVVYEYRAFGEQLKRLDASGDDTGDEAKYSYGGKELDEGSNLYYFNARYYDATIGRFINVDPVQDGSNWYVYCSNNPLNMVDPTGLKEKELNNGFFNTFSYSVYATERKSFTTNYKQQNTNNEINIDIVSTKRSFTATSFMENPYESNKYIKGAIYFSAVTVKNNDVEKSVFNIHIAWETNTKGSFGYSKYQDRKPIDFILPINKENVSRFLSNDYPFKTEYCLKLLDSNENSKGFSDIVEFALGFLPGTKTDDLILEVADLFKGLDNNTDEASEWIGKKVEDAWTNEFEK